MNMNKILTTAALALMMGACSNDYNEAALQPGAGHEITVTATINADGGSALTRAVAESGTTITSSLTADEQIAVLFSDGTDNLVRTATVKSVADGTATIEFTIPSSLANNTACTLVYPATAAKADNTDVKTYAELFATQTGVLSDDLDVRRGTATILNDGFTASLSDATKLAAQNAIVKFSLSYGSDAIAASQFLVKDGSDNVLTTVTPLDLTSDLYVAMAPASDAAFQFEASDGDFTYNYEKSGVTLAAGTYYQSPITTDVVAASMDVSASGFSGVYDGLPHGITVTVTSPTDAVVKYGTTEGIYDLDDSPKYKEIGEYTVYFQVTKDKYTTVTGSAKVVIILSSMTVTAEGYTGTYDAQPHGITVTAPTFASIRYGTTDGSYTETSSPEYTDAGTYTVYYQVKKVGYQTVTGSATVAISKAAGSISYGEDRVEKKVSDSPFKNETLTMTSDGTASVSYSSSNTDVATVNGSGEVTIKATGTTTITATITSSTNYSYSPDYAQYTLTVKSPNAVGPSGGYEEGGDPIPVGLVIEE
jgi:hypothetical protein